MSTAALVPCGSNRTMACDPGADCEAGHSVAQLFPPDTGSRHYDGQAGAHARPRDPSGRQWPGGRQPHCCQHQPHTRRPPPERRADPLAGAPDRNAPAAGRRRTRHRGPGVRRTGASASDPGPAHPGAGGTLIRATIRNTLADSTLVLHGLYPRPAAGDDTVQVAPGATREVSFAAGAPGTYFYWGTTSGKAMTDDRWIDSQLSGAFIVDPAGSRPANERVFVLGLYLRPGDSAAGRPSTNSCSSTASRGPIPNGSTTRWATRSLALDQRHRKLASDAPARVLLRHRDPGQRGGGHHVRRSPPAPRGHRAHAAGRHDGGAVDSYQPGNWVFHCHFAFHVSSELYLAPHAAPAPRGRSRHGAPDGRPRARHARAPRGGRTARAQSSPNSSAPHASALAPQVYRLVVRPVPSAPDAAHLMRYALEGARDRATDGPGIPGPLLTLERGRPARITVVNRLDEPTSVHWHGIELESYTDGVPGWSGTSGDCSTGSRRGIPSRPNSPRRGRAASCTTPTPTS